LAGHPLFEKQTSRMTTTPAAPTDAAEGVIHSLVNKLFVNDLQADPLDPVGLYECRTQ